ncbi:MAG: lytic transglycosylase domain-containing protein [Gemmatimonadota bacterium]
MSSTHQYGSQAGSTDTADRYDTSHGVGEIRAGIATVVATSALLMLAAQRAGPEEPRAGQDDDGPVTVADVHGQDTATASWDIPIHRTPEVERWIAFYTSESGRRSFEDWLDRMSLYEEPIRKELRSRGMPEDLVYIALIESGFEPRAVSSARASGLWQIMPVTAREQGLRVNPWVDERLDPVRSTTAAIEFLEALHARFGAWYLAVAAYNTGASRVYRALSTHVGAGPWSEDHFWSISPHLPRETQQHVPRLIAAAVLGKEPARFGFAPQATAPRAFETVYTLGETSLARLADAAGVPHREVRDLNPHLIRGVSPPGLFYPVRVPTGTARQVVAALSTGEPGVAEPGVGGRAVLAE